MDGGFCWEEVRGSGGGGYWGRVMNIYFLVTYYEKDVSSVHTLGKMKPMVL